VDDIIQRIEQLKKINIETDKEQQELIGEYNTLKDQYIAKESSMISLKELILESKNQNEELSFKIDELKQKNNNYESMLRKIINIIISEPHNSITQALGNILDKEMMPKIQKEST